MGMVGTIYESITDIQGQEQGYEKNMLSIFI